MKIREIGSKVKIRSYEDLKKRCCKSVSDKELIFPSGIHFIEEMRWACGKTFKIVRHVKSSSASISSYFFYALEGISYNFSEEMFEEEVYSMHIGVKYEVIDNDQTYYRHRVKFLELGGKNWKDGFMFDHGTIVSLLNKDEKGYYLITDGKNECVIGSLGIKMISDSSTCNLAEVAILKPITEQTQKGEVKMNVLERMASVGLNKEVEAAGATGLPMNIQEALKEQLLEESKNAAKQAATKIVGLIKDHDAHVEAKVKQIRSYRAAIEKELVALEKLNTAKAYGMETSNFVPLAILTRNLHVGHLEDKTLSEVPKEFKPKKEVKK